MESVTIVLGNIEKINKDWLIGEIIGVDYGAKLLAQQGIKMHLSIGDFDSVAREDLEQIKKYSTQMVVLQKEKELSDFEAALNYTHNYKKVYVLGGLGGRFDHQYVNFQLLLKDNRLVFLDEQNQIEVKKEGIHRLTRSQFQYISFFSLGEAIISLIGFKYALDHHHLTQSDLFTLSNELIYEKAKLIIHSGKVLMIQSNDKQKKED